MSGGGHEVVSLASPRAQARHLIDEYMVNREPLPDDDAAPARIFGVGLEDWSALANSIRRFSNHRAADWFTSGANVNCGRKIRGRSDIQKEAKKPPLQNTAGPMT
jgi:uncharacterized protein YdaU (DUF1376 family)